MAPKREMRLRPPLERKRVTAKPKRELHLEPKKKAKSSSSKILQKPDQKKDLLTPKGRYPTPFNLMDVDLWVPAGSLGAKKKRSRSVSSSTSATSDGNQGGRQLKKRRHRTSRCLVDELMEGKGLTLLEKSAIGPQSQKTYAAELEEFTIYAVPRGLDVRDSEGLDRLLVDYMNLLYLEGHQAYKADRLAASILHHYPQYGRHGDSKLPRLWRALKGFRKLCPGKSRLAYPLAIWAAVATRMRQLGHARMGLFVLMAVSTYGRPSEMLRLRVFSLVRPSPGITRKLDIADEPRGKTREVQDRGLRRVPKPRLTLDDKLVPHPLLPAQGQPSRSPPMGLRLQRVFKGVQEGGGGAWSGHHSVPDPSFRTFHRPSTWIPKSRRSPEKGPVEGLEVSGSLREVGKPPNEPADTLPAMRGKPWGNHVRIQKGARVWKRQKQQRYVMDLFAGKGGVSAACQALGFHAKQWDIIHGPEHDLTDKRVLKRLLQEIRRGRVLAVMMAPVCTSFSRARDRTKVIRNHRFPWGIPRRFLSEKEYLSIRLGNTLFRACFAIIEECEKQQIPWLLENPLSSRCWNLPPMRRIIQQRDTHFIHADFCSVWGSMEEAYRFPR